MERNPPARAIYRIDLRVSYQGSGVAENVAAKRVVDCRFGLLVSWIGPAIGTPPAGT